MKSLIRRCTAHDDPSYTVSPQCPDCGAATENTAPPQFSPDDDNGRYRRETKWRR